MTEEVDACPPAICTVLSCLKEIITEQGYAVGNECGQGKSSVSILTWITKMAPKKRRGSSCGGVEVEAVLVVQINVNNCSSDSCAGATAHINIRNALEKSKSACCANVIWRETQEINPDFHSQTETWTDVYTLSFLHK